MNAQSNHQGRTSATSGSLPLTAGNSTSNSTDITPPRFLGPEAGQRAGGKDGQDGQNTSAADPGGTELHRYFSVARGALLSVRSNGVTLWRQVDEDWKVLSRKKEDVPLAQWLLDKQAVLGTLARWQLEIDEVPSLSQLMAWDADGICETPTGHRVEPDGTGPDGVPSWLRALRLI